MGTTRAPGWYPDPSGMQQGKFRWWNGSQWTQVLSDTLWAPEPRSAPVYVPPPPEAVTPPPAPTPAPRGPIVIEIEDDSPRRWPLVAGVIAIVVVLVAAGIGVLLWTNRNGGTGTQARALASRSAAPTPRPPSEPTSAPTSKETAPAKSPAAPSSTNGWPVFAPPGGKWVEAGAAAQLLPHGQAQHYVTEPKFNGKDDWMAILLSGEIPQQVQESDDLARTATLVAEWYSGVGFGSERKPSMTRTDERALTVAGRSAYLLEGRIPYRLDGLKARADLVRIVILDLGATRRPGVFLASVPETHAGLWADIDAVLRSLTLKM